MSYSITGNNLIDAVIYLIGIVIALSVLGAMFGFAYMWLIKICGAIIGMFLYKTERALFILGSLVSSYCVWIGNAKQAIMIFIWMTSLSLLAWVAKRAFLYLRSTKAGNKFLYGDGQSNQNSDKMSSANSSAELTSLYSPRKPAFSFKDVEGMTGLKAQLLEAVAKNKSDMKNGILFSGDPGNGKTFIAEALAGELNYKFMPITIADIKSRWSGQTTEQLKAVFNAASNCGPVVLFFDECDSMLRDRSGMMGSDPGGASGDALGTANAFLTGIVDIRRNKNVIVMAASNYRDQLDAAATRDGRFDFKIEIPNPDREARLGLLNKFSKGVTYEDGVLDRLVKRWEGFSVVRIRSIAEKISDNAKAQGRTAVGVKDAMAALRSIQGSLGESLPEDTPKLTDMHFDEAERKKLMSLAKRMENIEEVERMGGQVPKGILFSGPPGTGKTAVAKALAMTSGWAFLSTSGNQLLSAPEEFIKILNKARDLRPCIVFIDESDDVLMDRASNPYGKSATNRLLAEMDGTKQLNDIMFVAATNHPDSLDSAAVRGGRFSERYEFKKPEDDTVLLMVREWIDARRVTTPFHAEFKPETVAKFLEGLAPADIKDKLQQAVNTGVGRMLSDGGVEQIMLSDLQAVM